MKIRVKRILLLICFLGLTQATFGQSCGAFRIKYKGKIINDTGLIKEIRVPSVDYIRGDVKRGRSKIIFTEYKVATTAEFNLTVSYATCSAGMSPKGRIEQITKGRESIPLLIITKKNKKRRVNVPLKDITFVEGTVGGKYIIMIDLKEIRI